MSRYSSIAYTGLLPEDNDAQLGAYQQADERTYTQHATSRADSTLPPNYGEPSKPASFITASSSSSFKETNTVYPRFGRVALLVPWFPKVDPKYHRELGWKSWRIWSSKRQSILWIAFTSSMAVLIINVVLVAVLGSKYKITSRRGLINLYEGDCKQVKMFGTGAHVCINILSTLLLGASNLCMQLLVAPTRKEIDLAHRKKIWLDVGIPSWRNLSNIKCSRKWLFFVLMISSVPLHFTYNSAISVSIPQYGFPAIVASESFVLGTDSSIGNWTEILSREYTEGWNEWPPLSDWDWREHFVQMRSNAKNPALYEKLNHRQCIERYADVFSNRSSLVIVLEERPENKNASVESYIYWPAVFGQGSSGYLCVEENPGPHQPECVDLVLNTDLRYASWTRFGRQVLYCLAERIDDDHCQFNYSPAIFIAVCCFSAVKCICIFITIFWHREATISTVGDAVASFLEFPDRTSAHMGPITKSTLIESKTVSWEASRAISWRAQSSRWYSVPSRKRWAIALLLFAIVATVALTTGILGAQGTTKRQASMTMSWQIKQPIGVPNSNAWTAYELPREGTVGFITHVMYANMWQVIVSFIYLGYNALLTCMLVGEEWAGFAHERKTLRVTHPRGIQRSSYFVSMPYKYGIPLMVANTVLHILISQSLFIVSIIAYRPDLVELQDMSYTLVGYSFSAIVVSVYVGCSTVFILIGISFFKISGDVPLVSTSSIAISAACHRPEDDVDAHLLPVRWGVISPEGVTPVQCSMTTLRDVSVPRVGEIITGKSDRCEVEWIEVRLSRTQRLMKGVALWFQRLLSKTKSSKRRQ